MTQWEWPGAVSVGHPNTGEAYQRQGPARPGDEIHANEPRQPKTRQGAAAHSHRGQKTLCNDFVRCLDFVLSAFAWAMICIFVSQVRATLHQHGPEQR